MSGAGGGAVIRIVGVHGQSSGAADAHAELLRIDHETGDSLDPAEWRLVRDRGGRSEELLRFPRLVDEARWTLDPGETIVVRSGAGHDTYYARAGMRPTFWLHIGAIEHQWIRNDRIWIEDGSGPRLSEIYVVQP